MDRHRRRSGIAPVASVTIEVPLSPGRRDPDTVESIRRNLQAIAPLVADRTIERGDAAFRAIVDHIVEATPIRPLDAVRAALERRAIDAVFDGTEWLTAEQIGRQRNPDAVNPHAIANRWASEGKVFGLSRGGVVHFPRYAFDEAFDPLPVMRRVLGKLAGYSPWRIASWLQSTNAHLGGARPRERLVGDPEAVVRAAEAHVLGPVHG